MEGDVPASAGRGKSFTFVISGATRMPDKVRLGPSECHLAGRELTVKPNPGQATRELTLREITGVERYTGPFGRKRVVVNSASSALVIWCTDKDEVLDIAAIFEEVLNRS